LPHNSSVAAGDEEKSKAKRCSPLSKVEAPMAAIVYRATLRQDEDSQNQFSAERPGALGGADVEE